MPPFLTSQPRSGDAPHGPRSRRGRPRTSRPAVEELEVRDLLAIPALPYPDHIVIAIEENHAYSQIIGSAAAPYINALAQQGALFTQSYGITHPSQPNYLHLFSGAHQSLTTDACALSPRTTPNLGASLLQAGYTFAGYSESLPSVGSTVCTSGAYARKHSPWVNWQGASRNAIPASANLRWADFPADYRTLPTLSFVIPNQDNDMHNGSDPARITRGDTWLRNNLDAYVQWTYANNSLFILTFDEDNGLAANRIATLFIGPMVRPGQYSQRITHHDLLRTVLDMYGLPYAGASATASPILNAWANPWEQADVGAVGAAGSALVYADYYYAARGAGAGVGGTADALHYVYQPLHGDGWIVAQVTGLDAGDAAARAGVMIRADLTAGAAQALLGLAPTGESQLITRATAGGTSTTIDGPALSIPSYVYLMRSAEVVSGWVYSDATDWVYMGSDTLALGQDVYIGLAVTSGVPGVLGTGSFESVYVDAGGGGAPVPGQGGAGHSGQGRLDAVERVLVDSLSSAVPVVPGVEDHLRLCAALAVEATLPPRRVATMAFDEAQLAALVRPMRRGDVDEPALAALPWELRDSPFLDRA